MKGKESIYVRAVNKNPGSDRNVSDVGWETSNWISGSIREGYANAMNEAHSMDANESTGVPREVARQSTLVVGVDNILQRASERIQNLFHKDDENNPIQLRPVIDEQPRFYVSLRTLRRYEIRPWIHARLPSKMPAPKSSRSPRRDPPFVAIAMAWRTMFMLNGDT